MSRHVFVPEIQTQTSHNEFGWGPDPVQIPSAKKKKYVRDLILVTEHNE